MSTANAIITQARRLLSDANDMSFEQSDLEAFLNEGMQRFAAETHVCQKIYLKSGITASLIPFSDLITTGIDEVLQVTKIQLIDGAGDPFLTQSPLMEKTERLAAGITTPDRFTLFADSIILNTAVDQTLSLSLNVYFSYKPSEITDFTATIPIPVQWEQALVKYIVFCGMLMIRDSGGANGALAEYDELRQTAAKNVIARMA